MRRPVRWHSAKAAAPVGSLIAIATALAMAGALVLDTGIAALAPSMTSRVAAQPTAGALPTDPLVAFLVEIVPVPAPEVSTGGISPDAAVARLIATASARSPIDEQSRRAIPTSDGSLAVDGVSVLYPLTVVLVPDTADVADVATAVPGGRTSASRMRPAVLRAGTSTQTASQSTARRKTSWSTAPIVTWYGPGFYGNRTACGVRYTRYVVGVAHRKLPCGTLVRFRWHGITHVAPVIDRGPYASRAYVFDFSAWLACHTFRPHGVANSCYTRHNVRYKVVGKVNLKRYLRHRHHR